MIYLTKYVIEGIQGSLDLCRTPYPYPRPRYQVSVYRTNIGLLVFNNTADSSSDSHSSEESDQNEGQSSRSPEQEVKVRVLTEKEMNELGAKILKAELMGNQVCENKMSCVMRKPVC